jgi:Protein of unknown function (DUF3592)
MDTIGYGGIPLLIMGIGFAAFALWAGRRARTISEDAQHWPTTTATITKSRTWYYRGSYTPQIRYTYEIAGDQFRRGKIRPGFGGFNRAEQAREIVDKYPVGARVPARYDPEKPKRAYLETDAATRGVKPLVWTGAIMAVIGGGFLAVGLLHLAPDGGPQLAGDEHHWGHRHQSTDVDLYYDASTVERRPDGVHVVERMNYSQPQERGIRFLVSASVYDCTGHRMRMVHGTYYDGEGQRIGEEDWPDEPYSANRSGSIGAGVEREVCGS